jgi:hypothetical protein
LLVRNFDAEDLSFYVAKSKKPEEVGLGRNVALFDWLRHWAYRAVRRYRPLRGQFTQWQAECHEKALGRNGDFARPLDGRECYHVAKSVAKWTWRKDAEAQARFLARLAASEDLRASARLLRAQGMNNHAIARCLGVPRSTVIRWLHEGGEGAERAEKGGSTKPKSDNSPVDLGKRRREP